MISCIVYDYIEIACIYRLTVTLELKSELQISGVAINTKRNESGLECIELIVDSNNILIILEDVKVMRAQVENPHFSEVNFL